jgi:predicted nucleic acid-binding protein
MLKDICVDTDILGELLGQYVHADRRLRFRAKGSGAISEDLALRINQNISAEFEGLVVASSMAFVELARKFDAITEGRVSVLQLAAFLEQHPKWFSVEPLTVEAMKEFVRLPTYAVQSGNELKPLEGCDNYHVAAMEARENCQLATNDSRLRDAYENTGKLVG